MQNVSPNHAGQWAGIFHVIPRSKLFSISSNFLLRQVFCDINEAVKNRQLTSSYGVKQVNETVEYIVHCALYI